MSERPPFILHRAIVDYRSARRKAALHELLSHITGQSTELLAFDDVRRKLKAQVGVGKTLKDIPIKSIIGSVNRYQDFYKGFLPSRRINLDRWINIELANQGMMGLPPIEAYQIGDVYFVSDGNHRVSVAKHLGSTHIQAYVTDVYTRVPLSDDIKPDELILKSEYAEFLESTKMDELRPGADLSVTVPGEYDALMEHIAVHRYYMGIKREQRISFPEAAVDWYDRVYLPVVELIRNREILVDFPKRTETDFYLWLADHKASLEEELNSQVPLPSAVQDLADRFSKSRGRSIKRIKMRLADYIIPEFLENGPSTGEWRTSILSFRKEDLLFCDILVPVNGHPDGWCALQQAIDIAQKEDAYIHGLYVIANEEEMDSNITHEIEMEFYKRCTDNNIGCEFKVMTGKVAVNICYRASLVDLVVMNLAFPPKASIIDRFQSGIRNLIQTCPRPILFTPNKSSSINRTLLIFDGTSKDHEALYITAYIVRKWKLTLDVIISGKGKKSAKNMEFVRSHLDSLGIHAQYPGIHSGSRTEIMEYIENDNIDLLVTGGYKYNPIREIIFGSQLDDLLDNIKIPLIVAR